MKAINNYTERFREWLAWKIFPEIDMYFEVVKRVAEMDENDRCVKALDDADSACSGWAIDQIKIKYVGLELIHENLKAEGFEQPPF